MYLALTTALRKSELIKLKDIAKYGNMMSFMSSEKEVKGYG